MKKLLFAVPLAVLLAAGCSSSQQASNQTPIQTQVAGSQNNDSIKISTYTSDILGVSFDYSTYYADTNQPIKVLEKGNIIYLYPSGTPSDQGEILAVFDKNPLISLDDAIKQKFFKNASNCGFVNPSLLINLPPTFETTIIQPNIIDKNSTDDLVNFYDSVSKYCKGAESYVFSSDGGAIFLMDKSHPQKFASVKPTSDIHYAGNASGDKAWFETIRFK